MDIQMVSNTSIILLTKNAGEKFDDLLNRIHDQQFPGDIELVVVDSGSTDETVTIARNHGATIAEIDPEQFHHSRTRNRGARLATHDILVYLTQDAMPVNDQWLQRLVAPIENGEAETVYGRQIAYSDAKPMDEFFYNYFYPDRKITLGPTDVVDERQFYLDNVFISDVCSAIDRTVWEEHQFRNDVPMSEDKDFALRILRAGNRVVYEPDATVRHSHQYHLRSMCQRRYNDGKAYAQITHYGTDNFGKEGVTYVIEELKYLLQHGYHSWIPYAILYDAMHYIGFTAGKLVGRVAKRSIVQ